VVVLDPPVVVFLAGLAGSASWAAIRSAWLALPRKPEVK
jgi:hypothetical protein